MTDTSQPTLPAPGPEEPESTTLSKEFVIEKLNNLYRQYGPYLSKKFAVLDVATALGVQINRHEKSTYER
jgi:hypothetical protein